MGQIEIGNEEHYSIHDHYICYFVVTPCEISVFFLAYFLIISYLCH